MKKIIYYFDRFKWHFVFWVVYFLYIWLPEGSTQDNYEGFFIYACSALPIVMACTYYTIFVTVERFLLHKKRFQFWISLIASMVVFGLIRRYINHSFIYPMLWPDKPLHQLLYLPRITIDAVQIHLIASVGAMIYLLGKWKEQQLIANTLLKEKIAAELELLKSQVQPHFIFNTLNNIYMLSLKGSSQTSDMVYRLSALLSYMLYDSKQETIEVEKEVDYIKNYINLEKIRYGARLDVQLNVYNNVKGIRVPPLLILPMVENAFKHGVSKVVKDSWIHIDIALKNHELVFKIENSCSDTPLPQTGFGNGLGLENLRKRLEILYPNRFELKTMREEDTFLATLRLDIKPDHTEGGYIPESDLIREKNGSFKEKELAVLRFFVPFFKI
jgi:two-component system, LytTR family, sensor kinase